MINSTKTFVKLLNINHMEFIEVNGYWWRSDSDDFGGWAENFNHYLIRTEDILGAKEVFFELYQDRNKKNIIEKMVEIKIKDRVKKLLSAYLPNVDVSFVIAESLENLTYRLANNIMESPKY